jgi:hypothetical protein
MICPCSLVDLVRQDCVPLAGQGKIREAVEAFPLFVLILVKIEEQM